MIKKVWIMTMILFIFALYNILFLLRMTLKSRTDAILSSFHVQIQPVYTQKTIDEDYVNQMSRGLQIYLKVESNTMFNNKCKLKLTLKNTGAQTLFGRGWEIYFDSVKMVEPDFLPKKEAVLDQYGVKFRHWKGTQFILSPTKNFIDLIPNSEINIHFHISAWIVARSELFPNWYIRFDGLKPSVIENTRNTLNYMSSLNRPEQWKRNDDDKYNPFTAEDRYRRYHDSKNNQTEIQESSIPIIPKPLHVIRPSDGGKIKVDKSWLIQFPQTLTSEATYLKGETNFAFSTTQTSEKVIVLQTGDLLHPLTKANLMNIEAYKLEVSSKASRIIITGKSASGVFNGIQSFLSLYSTSTIIPDITITDQPRLSYRGLHVDVSRNFHPVSYILKLIDGMAMVKMNKLHLHLSDDEGWRLEIPGLPELTQFGAKRCFDLDKCLPPQLGSGPDTSTSGSGFYTISDYKRILQYATTRHLQVIPSFDMPGHARAPIKAMEMRYHNKFKQNKTAAEEYLLHDLNDKSKYQSIQLYDDDAANPCLNSTYTFVAHVIDELIKIHKDIQPLTLYHFGGDEVGKGAWTNSSICQKLFHGKPVKTDRMKELFLKRVADITSKRGLDVAAWEDGLMKNNQPFNRSLVKSKDVYAYTWKDVWEWGDTDNAYKMANAGYKVIMCQATHLYFDHPQEPDPEEHGFLWATRFIDIKKVFSLILDDIYQNIGLTRFGKTVTKTGVCTSIEKCPPLTKPENLVGIQAQLWSETIRTSEVFDSMIFPRLLAVAERGWYKADWESISTVTERQKYLDKDWSRFSEILSRNYLSRLEKIGIRYRISLPGGILQNKRILTNTEFSGDIVEYYLPDKNTWSVVPNSTLDYTKNIPILLRTRNRVGSRKSRNIVLYPEKRKIRTSEVFDSMIFPRLLAVAERGWYKADWESISTVTERQKYLDKDWSRFSEILSRNYLSRLEKIGIRYRISLPGGM